MYLICPLFAVLGAAVASLATAEAGSLASRAVGIGARRFAPADTVSRTWLSATEQIDSSTDRSKEKWLSFIQGVLPAPLLAAILPGTLSFKAIIAAASAAAQARPTWHVALDEYEARP